MFCWCGIWIPWSNRLFSAKCCLSMSQFLCSTITSSDGYNTWAKSSSSSCKAAADISDRWTRKFNDLMNLQNSKFTNSFLEHNPQPKLNQNSSKDHKLILILTMKLLYIYFWKTLPSGDLIWLTPIWLAFSKSSQIVQPTSNHLKRAKISILCTVRNTLRQWGVFANWKCRHGRELGCRISPCGAQSSPDTCVFLFIFKRKQISQTKKKNHWFVIDNFEV